MASANCNSGFGFFSEEVGNQIQLSVDGLTARRQAGFCNGVVVTSHFIQPGQIFALEVVETESGWSGDLRVGFTMLNCSRLFPLPSFAIPDLVDRGQTWMCSVSRALQSARSNKLSSVLHLSDTPDENSTVEPFANSSNTSVAPREIDSTTNPESRNTSFAEEKNCAGNYWFRTSYGALPRSQLTCQVVLPNNDQFSLASDKGSVIAVYYELETSTHSSNPQCLRFSLLVNGIYVGCWHEQQISGCWNPKRQPIRAVVDVYGVTKAVRIIDAYSIVSLENLCEQAVLHYLEVAALSKLQSNKLDYNQGAAIGFNSNEFNRNEDIQLSDRVNQYREYQIYQLPLPRAIIHKLLKSNELTFSSLKRPVIATC